MSISSRWIKVESDYGLRPKSFEGLTDLRLELDGALLCVAGRVCKSALCDEHARWFFFLWVDFDLTLSYLFGFAFSLEYSSSEETEE